MAPAGSARVRRPKVTTVPLRRRKKVEQVYVHDIEGQPGQNLLITWNDREKSLVGDAVSPSVSRRTASAAHGPYIVPANGDDTKVWRCDWDNAITNYRCRLVDIGSPDATLV